MSQMTAVEYTVPETVAARRATSVKRSPRGASSATRARECGKVYVPPRGYCPLCVVPTSEADEVEVADARHDHHVLGDHAAAVPGPGGDRGLRAGDDPARRVDIRRSACSASTTSRSPTCTPGMRVEAMWRPESERKRRRRRGPRASRSARRSRAGSRPASPTLRSSSTPSTSSDRARRGPEAEIA